MLSGNNDMMRIKPLVLISVCLIMACPATQATPDAASPLADAGTPDAGADGGSSPSDAGVAPDGGVAGLSLMTRLTGLWTGPARMTPLGDFPLMVMDFRPVGDRFLFGQADMDASNNLRFGFSIETYDGADVLAYRNGGLFGGVLRDSRTRLVEADEAQGRYRFCSVTQGCGYIDATFRFSSADDLVFDTLVKGRQHVFWTARRKETRSTPSPFPATLTSMGDGSTPWPAMASVQATVRWLTPLAQPGSVWVMLTTTNCAPTFACQASRSMKLDVAAAASSATISIPAVHAGDYKITAVVDRQKQFGTRLAPSSGDSIAVDQPLTVPTAGQATADVLAAYTVP